jgi:two-component system, sensor histidine kinase PdtaS
MPRGVKILAWPPHCDVLEEVRLSKLAMPPEERGVLIGEIHHRVKNNLAVITSLLNMKANTVRAPEAKVALEDALCRVRAMALVQEHLYASENFDQIDFGDCVKDLVHEISMAFDNRPGRISVAVDASPIRLSVSRAIPCALILNELLTNTFKHAFPTNRSGEVHVYFREAKPAHLDLAVRDNGIGSSLDRTQPREASGLEMVQVLARQLGGTVERQSGPGTGIAVRFPAA